MIYFAIAVSLSSLCDLNLCSAKILKTIDTKDFFQFEMFEIIINVLVSSFRLIRTSMLWVYGL